MTINKIKINTRTINQHLDKRMFLAVSSAFCMLLMMYVYFVGSTVFNIVERKSAESTMRTLSSSISDMEIEYITLAKNIDLTMAKTLGFNEPKDVYFAARTPVVGAISKTSDEL